VNVVLSFVLSKAFSGNLELGQITASFGNVTLLEAMALFLYGGAIELTSTVMWSSMMRLLRIPTKHSEEDEMLFTRVGVLTRLIKKSAKDIDKKPRSTEPRAITYILCGGILLVEIVALALLSG
jgi:hypothetical protein